MTSWHGGAKITWPDQGKKQQCVCECEFEYENERARTHAHTVYEFVLCTQDRREQLTILAYVVFEHVLLLAASLIGRAVCSTVCSVHFTEERLHVSEDPICNRPLLPVLCKQDICNCVSYLSTCDVKQFLNYKQCADDSSSTLSNSFLAQICYQKQIADVPCV